MSRTPHRPEVQSNARPKAMAQRMGVGSGESAGLSNDDERFLQSLAARVRRAGLVAPAVLWLSSIRPLTFLGSQALHVAAPLIDILVPDDGATRLARLMEDRAILDRFLDYIESPEVDAGVPS